MMILSNLNVVVELKQQIKTMCQTSIMTMLSYFLSVTSYPKSVGHH